MPATATAIKVEVFGLSTHPTKVAGGSAIMEEISDNPESPVNMVLRTPDATIRLFNPSENLRALSTNDG